MTVEAVFLSAVAGGSCSRAEYSFLKASGTAYFAKQGHDAVSCALTTAETPEMAMVGGVFTDEAYRNRGFARDCTVNLCRDLVARQKEVYLFYEAGDPLLTGMYRNIGFEETGTWVVATQRQDTR